MSADQWIIVPNWDRFQHYSDREPVWIKVYTELNSRGDWWDLSWAQRGILITVWIEYARSNGLLRCDQVQHLAKTWLRPGDLKALNDAGLIELSASKPSRARAHTRSQETEKRREEHPLTPSQSEGEPHLFPLKRNPRAAGTNPRAQAAQAGHHQYLEPGEGAIVDALPPSIDKSRRDSLRGNLSFDEFLAKLATLRDDEIEIEPREPLKRYQCPACEERFETGDELLAHADLIHTP